jgi:hypothetical protein
VDERKYFELLFVLDNIQDEVGAEEAKVSEFITLSFVTPPCKFEYKAT